MAALVETILERVRMTDEIGRLDERRIGVALPDTRPQGAWALARDLMVINVTKEDIKVRMATVDEYVLPPNVTDAYKKAPRTDTKHPSKEILAGKWEGYTPPPMPKR